MSTIAQYARAWKFQLDGTTYNSTNCIFVDAFSGDDLRGLGTKEFPFQTLNKAFVYAYANSKNYIIARGYFSENIPIGYAKYLYSDQFGDFIFDGQNIYTITPSAYASPQIATQQKNGIIVLNSYAGSFTSMNYYSIFLNSCYNSLSGSRCIFKGISYQYNNTYGYGSLTSGNGSYNAFIDYFNAVRSTTNSSSKNIYDNCKIFVDKSSANVATFDTCLFRSNCTFWKRNAANTADERIDNDTMNAAQKYAAFMDWLNNGTLASGYYKFGFTNCQFTDNRIFNCPDGDRSGTNFDFSLIYGTKENQPACYMDGGKHIGPFPPAIKIEFKNTADLTSSMYEVEIKPTDNLNNVNGSISLGANFTGATIYSKPMLIPSGTSFNGFNLSLFPDMANSGLFVTGQTDSIDTSDGNKLTVTAGGIALSANVVYLVKADAGTSVTYNGTANTDKMTLQATDNVLLASKNGTGLAYLYAINHPSIWQNIQFKICESATVPSDFKTNDTAYPWLDAEVFSKPTDVRGTSETGLRCLRVGNVNSGAIDLGTDGKALTSAHPEYYNATNQARIKYYVRANYVMLRIKITRLFS